MLSTAERAGSYEEALDRIADYYESETDIGGRQTAVVVGLVFYLIVAGVIFFIVFNFWSGYFGRYTALLE
jgi:type II secretory pathway component PulF